MSECRILKDYVAWSYFNEERKMEQINEEKKSLGGVQKLLQLDIGPSSIFMDCFLYCNKCPLYVY